MYHPPQFPKDSVHSGFVNHSLTRSSVSNYVLASNIFPRQGYRAGLTARIVCIVEEAKEMGPDVPWKILPPSLNASLYRIFCDEHIGATPPSQATIFLKGSYLEILNNF